MSVIQINHMIVLLEYRYRCVLLEYGCVLLEYNDTLLLSCFLVLFSYVYS